MPGCLNCPNSAPKKWRFLFNVTTAAAASPDLDESLNQVVETLRATLRVTNASIYLPDDSGQFMIKGAEVGTGRF